MRIALIVFTTVVAGSAAAQEMTEQQARLAGEVVGQANWALKQCQLATRAEVEIVAKALPAAIPSAHVQAFHLQMIERYMEAAKRANEIGNGAACAEISDRISRLPPPAARMAKPELQLSLTDLKLDMKTLVGRTVIVSGTLSLVTDQVALLRDGRSDPTPVTVLHDTVASRDQRKALLERCRGFPGCTISIKGEITHVIGKLGIKAREATVK